MELRMSSLALGALYVALLACTPRPSGLRSSPDPLAEVAALLSCSFSSAAQAQSDSGFFDVYLHMVPIWPERHGEHWLYVEQAVATALDKPYRHRVYRLVTAAEGTRSEVYTLPGDPLHYAGAWREPERFAGLPRENRFGVRSMALTYSSACAAGKVVDEAGTCSPPMDRTAVTRSSAPLPEVLPHG